MTTVKWKGDKLHQIVDFYYDFDTIMLGLPDVLPDGAVAKILLEQMKVSTVLELELKLLLRQIQLDKRAPPLPTVEELKLVLERQIGQMTMTEADKNPGPPSKERKHGAQARDRVYFWFWL